MEMLGNVMGMYSMSPSFSGGMNSWPSFIARGTDEISAKIPRATVDFGRRSATYTNGL